MRIRVLGVALAALALTVAVPLAQAPAGVDAEKAAIVQAALDYGDGYYSGAPERMERAIHPDLNKMVAIPLPKTGKVALRYSTYSGLIEATRAKLGVLDSDKRKIGAEVLLVDGNAALAKVTSAMFNDFLHLIKVNGQWKIINVLWAVGPDSPNRPPIPTVDAASAEPAIRQAALDFLEGTMAGDAARVERALHGEVNRIAYGTIPGGAVALNRARYSSLVEPVRAGLATVPEADRGVEFKLIAVMDGMAQAVASTPRSAQYLQLALIEGQWKIVNILATPRTPATGR